MVDQPNDDFEDDGPPPPTAERVLRRALALASVSLRAAAETIEDAEQVSQLLEWLGRTTVVRNELEAHELQMIETTVGALDPLDTLDGGWRAEGLVVLAWALGLAELPDLDTCSDPALIGESLGFLQDTLPPPALRDEGDIDDAQERLFAIHWRVKEFRRDGGPMNFPTAAQTMELGPVDIAGVPLANDDLAIGGIPIANAPKDAVTQCHSIAEERHKAANWLCGDQEIYSEVDASA